MADTMEDTATTHFNGAVPIKRARTELMAPDSNAQLRRRKEAEKAYGRGRKIQVKSVKDRKLRGNLKALENKYKDATMRAKDAEILLENTEGYLEPETELERTYKTTQDEIKKGVPIATAQMGFDLKLEGGPYVADYTRNGRELLLAGRKGHVATMDWRVSLCEISTPINHTANPETTGWKIGLRITAWGDCTGCAVAAQ
jgi:U3 small nucleolar RNA-associated protein 7